MDYRNIEGVVAPVSPKMGSKFERDNTCSVRLESRNRGDEGGQVAQVKGHPARVLPVRRDWLMPGKELNVRNRLLAIASIGFLKF